jgi:hypothetical protein
MAIAALAAVAVPSLAQSPPEASIPADFQGIWGLGAAACRTTDWRNVDTLVRIAADAITYWESECRPVGTVRRLRGGQSLRLEFTCAGEGETWEITQLWGRLQAGPDAFLVTVTPETDQVLFYRRCEGPAILSPPAP